MSNYVTLIEAEITPPNTIQVFGNGAIIESSGETRYLLTRSTPEQAIQSLKVTWPFTSYRVRHQVRSDNRTDLLFNALRMKFQADHIVYNWYKLSDEHLLFFDSINEANYIDLIRRIEVEESGLEVQDVTKRPGATQNVRCSRQMSPEEIEELRAQLLAQMEL